MIFKNKTDKQLRFLMCGEKYKVEPNGTIDIPEKFAYAVKNRGLPLEPQEPDAESERVRDTTPPPRSTAAKPPKGKAAPAPSAASTTATSDASGKSLAEKLLAPDPVN
jgi:hypothetical protein